MHSVIGWLSLLIKLITLAASAWLPFKNDLKSALDTSPFYTESIFINTLLMKAIYVGTSVFFPDYLDKTVIAFFKSYWDIVPLSIVSSWLIIMSVAEVGLLPDNTNFSWNMVKASTF